MDWLELDRETALQDYEINRISHLQNEHRFIQKKTFTKWINSWLAEGERNDDTAGKDRLEVKDLFSDLSDGTVLLRLLEALSGEAIGRSNGGHLRIHKLENVNRVMDFLHSNVGLQSIGAEDIVDGNQIPIISLVWSLILHFHINKIGSQLAKDGVYRTSPSPQAALLQWCRSQAAGYSGVDIQNFSASWRDGLGFNALIHAHRPELIQYYSLTLDDSITNLNNAFKVAQEHLGVPMILDAEDVNINIPDERSIITYVASLYRALNNGNFNARASSSSSDTYSPPEDRQEKWDVIDNGQHIDGAYPIFFGYTSLLERTQQIGIPSSNCIAGVTDNAMDQSTPMIKVSEPVQKNENSFVADGTQPLELSEEEYNFIVGVSKPRQTDPAQTPTSTETTSNSSIATMLPSQVNTTPSVATSATGTTSTIKPTVIPQEPKHSQTSTPHPLSLLKISSQTDPPKNPSEISPTSKENPATVPVTRHQVTERTTGDPGTTISQSPRAQNEWQFLDDGTERLELSEEEYNFIMAGSKPRQTDVAQTPTSTETSSNSSIATMQPIQVNTTPSVATGVTDTTSTTKPVVMLQETKHSQTSTPHTLLLSTTSSQTAPPRNPAEISPKSNISLASALVTRHQVAESCRSDSGTTVSPSSGAQYEWQFLDDGTEQLELNEEEYNFIMGYSKPRVNDPAQTPTSTETPSNSSTATMHPSQVDTTPSVATRATGTTSTIKPTVIPQEPKHSQTSTPHPLSLSTTNCQTDPKINPVVIPPKSNISQASIPVTRNQVADWRRSYQGTIVSLYYGSQYTWQQDKAGNWIRYRKHNADGNGSNATDVSSVFQERTLTNINFLTQRPIRRRIESALPISPVTTTGTYHWFFQDDTHGWIKYGEANDTNGASFVTTASSADIERHYKENPKNVMVISSAKFSYILDFVTMTQMNTTTYSVRPISRRTVSETSTEKHCSPSSPVPVEVPNIEILGKKLVSIHIDDSQSEYKEVVLHIKRTFPRCIVQNLVNIRNAYLWRAYENRKEFLKENYPEILFKEEFLFHGTNSSNVEAICKENLDWRLHGTSSGNKFGRGTYFSNNAMLSAHYCGKESPRVMFVVRVLIGRFIKGTQNTVKPPKDGSGLPYDTTVDDVTSPSIYVKYDSNEYYPQYYFEFM